jgi:hypothetical protein
MSPASSALLALLALGACAGRDGQSAGGPAAQPVAAAPTDPVVAFAAQAQPGAESRIILAGGQPANVRLLRSYNAASGRECREVLVGAGTTQRAQLVCQAEGGAWVAARPLLRGGGVARP